jgi:DNA-binding response OmpR family regulator
VARILLVEDDFDVRPLLKHILRTEPTYDVVSVETMANALVLLDQQPFDLVITDVNLPDGSGLRVADKSRARGVRALVFTRPWPQPRAWCARALRLSVEAAPRR